MKYSCNYADYHCCVDCSIFSGVSDHFQDQNRVKEGQEEKERKEKRNSTNIEW